MLKQLSVWISANMFLFLIVTFKIECVLNFIKGKKNRLISPNKCFFSVFFYLKFKYYVYSTLDISRFACLTRQIKEAWWKHITSPQGETKKGTWLYFAQCHVVQLNKKRCFSLDFYDMQECCEVPPFKSWIHHNLLIDKINSKWPFFALCPTRRELSNSDISKTTLFT